MTGFTQWPGVLLALPGVAVILLPFSRGVISRAPSPAGDGLDEAKRQALRPALPEFR